MEAVIVWLAGSFVANLFADVVVMALLTNSIPTWYGLVYSFCNVKKLGVPTVYARFNAYFSLLFTWALAALLFITLMIIILYGYAKRKRCTVG